MSTKISIFKTSADGEQVNVEIDVTPEHLKLLEPKVAKGDKSAGVTDVIMPGKSLRQVFDYAFRLVDDRLFEMNQRVIASNVLVKKLPPEAQYAIQNVMEVLHGRSSGPPPAEIIEEAKREQAEALRAREQANVDLPE